MQRLPFPFIIFAFLALANCDYQTSTKGLPFFAERVLDTLKKEKQPIKIELDMIRNQVYWLNRLGEIYRIQPDGTQVELINKGIGADIGITFIEDFYLDAEHGHIYFTDLFDLESGSSAIKKSNLDGENTETVATFHKETPVQITSRPGSNSIYYITQEKNFPNTTIYHLGTIRQDTQEKTVLYTSAYALNFDQLPEFRKDEPTFPDPPGIALR